MDAGSAEGTLLDRALPRWHFREVHRRRLDASPAETMRAALGLRVRDLPLGTALMALRMVPTVLATRRRPPARLDQPLFESFLGLGFVELGRSEREIALGAVGRFWRLREQLEPLADAEAFERFDEPSVVKGAMNLLALPAGDATELVTETRVWATDEGARRRFRPYWVPVRLGGGLIRRELLRATARQAQR